MSDFAIKLDQARQRLPLKTLMVQYGRGPENGHWKSFPHCPYCRKEGCAGVFGGKHGDLFKCLYSGCPSGTQHDLSAWDEIAFLAYEGKLNREEAAIAYLKAAGVWQEERLAPSVMPGQRARRKRLDSAKSAESAHEFNECHGDGKRTADGGQRTVAVGEYLPSPTEQVVAEPGAGGQVTSPLNMAQPSPASSTVAAESTAPARTAGGAVGGRVQRRTGSDECDCAAGGGGDGAGCGRGSG